jgi:hypothetical protein
MSRQGSPTPEPSRRGRHRTTTPARLIAAFSALLVTGGIVIAAGQAAAQSESGDDSGLLSSLTDSGGSGNGDDSGDNGGAGSGDSADQGQSDGQDATGQDENGQDANGQDANAQDENGQDQNGQDANGQDANGQDDNGQAQNGQEAQAAADPFPGRDEIAAAGADQYVNISDVDAGDPGEGGQFKRGSYSVDCGVSDHNNSDNYMAAPGKRNGAQHVHDYVGNTSTNANSDDDSLDEAQTSCGNGDRSTFFWPVLRNLNGTGSDVGEDGGSLDGNVGSILQPQSARLTFHGHGDRPVVALPHHLMMIMGNAKAGAQNGDNVNAKYTCTGQESRITTKYPICGAGSQLMRILDYPSCWNGEDLESANFRDHMAFPDERGNCGDGFKPIPALRITLTYDQPQGRAFSIDSFPNEQHAPNTDHSDFENFSSPASADAGAACINGNRTCSNLPQ